MSQIHDQLFKIYVLYFDTYLIFVMNLLKM